MFEAIFLKSSLAVDISIDYTNSDYVVPIEDYQAHGSSQGTEAPLTSQSLEHLGPRLTLGYMHAMGDSHTVIGEIGGSYGELLSGEAGTGGPVSGFAQRDVADGKSRGMNLKIGVKSRWFNTPGHYRVLYFGYDRYKHDSSVDVKNDAGIEKPSAEKTSKSSLTSQRVKFGLATEHDIRIGVMSAAYEYGDAKYGVRAEQWESYNGNALTPSNESIEGGSQSIKLTYTAPISSAVDMSISYQYTNFKPSNNSFPQSPFEDVKFNTYSLQTGISIRF
ncbi:MAG: hypothetical protein EOO52_13680 [Gammaproteobacteria bacterium]|nr:MAG: hypothetical protein EOO52_13680 [Gammaproteobacteria bacterium]